MEDKGAKSGVYPQRQSVFSCLKKPHDLIVPKKGQRRGVSTLLNLNFECGFNFTSIVIHSNQSNEMSILGPYGREREKLTNTSSASDENIPEKEDLNMKGSLPQKDKQ